MDIYIIKNKVKRHVQENKERLICGGIGLAVGVLVTKSRMGKKADGLSIIGVREFSQNPPSVEGIVIELMNGAEQLWRFRTESS